MQTKREFFPADRYYFDFGRCSYDKGFAQVDTKQDASYYGTWASPAARTVLNYAEGDVTIHVCESDEEFAQCLRDIDAWHVKHGYGNARIDPGFGQEMKQAFINIGLADLLH